MKIRFVLPFAFNSDEAIDLRAEQALAASLDSDTQVDCITVRNHPLDLSCHYEESLLDMYVTEAGLSAEKDGYDAVVMDTVSDSGLYTLRSRLSIPVIGPGQAAYTVAALLGKRFSMLVYAAEHKIFYEKSLALYGMSEKCASMRVIDIEPDYEKLIGHDASGALKNMEREGRAALETDGADVLVFGSTTMHPLFDAMSERFDVPIIDPGPVALKLAETLVKLNLSHSKKAFPSPRDETDHMWHALPSIEQSGSSDVS